MKLASVSVAALIAIGVGSSAQAELSMVPTLADYTSWTSGIGADQFANIKPIAGAELFVANYATSDEDPTMTMATSELDSDVKWFMPGSEEMMVNIKPIAGAYSADVLAAAKAAGFDMDTLGVQVDQFANIKPIAGAERFAVNYATSDEDPTMTMATSELDSDVKWFMPGSEEMMVNIKPIAGAYSADVLAAAKAAGFDMDTLGVQVDQFANIKPIAGAERFAVNYATNNDIMDVVKAYTSNSVSGTWANAMNDNSIWNATVINYK